MRASARVSTRRRVTSWLLLAAVPVAAVLGASVALATVQAQGRQARSDRLFVQHIHEGALLQHTLVTHAIVMGYVTPDLITEVAQLRADAASHLQPSTAPGRTRQAALIDAAWRPFKDTQMQALSTLRHISDTMSGPVGHVGSDAGGRTADHVRAGPHPPFDAAITAVSRAETAFAVQAASASRTSLLGSVGAATTRATQLPCWSSTSTTSRPSTTVRPLSAGDAAALLARPLATAT